MAKSMYKTWDDLFKALERLRDIFIVRPFTPMMRKINELIERTFLK